MLWAVTRMISFGEHTRPVIGMNTFHVTGITLSFSYIPSTGEVIGFCPLGSAAFTRPKHAVNTSVKSSVIIHSLLKNILAEGRSINKLNVSCGQSYNGQLARPKS
jgi:hypothetical protein